MDYKMEIVALLLCVIPALVSTITITSNGNSPEIKMKGGMMVDMQKGFVPITPSFAASTIKASKIKPKSSSNNSTKLSINERYRRLIPYMTFYYANDLATPAPDTVKEVEVEKAEIIETGGLGHDSQREPKKIIYSNRNIPRYQGNRLTQHNIASANPTKVFYKGGVPLYQTTKVTPNYNPLLSDYNVLVQNDYEPGRVIQKQTPKTINIAYLSPTRKPYLNLYNENTPNIRYYLSEKEQSPKYKLVPYEQTPPVKVPEHETVYEFPRKPAPVPVPVSGLLPRDQIYSKPRPAQPSYFYEEQAEQPAVRQQHKQPSVVAESYYEKYRPILLPDPIIQSGFKPIIKSPQYTKEEPVYSTVIPETVVSDVRHQSHRGPVISIDDLRPKYYQYVPAPATTQPPRATSTTVPLATLLSSLQLNKSIPKPITKDNVGSSIRTLLQVLTALKAVPQHNDVEAPVLSSPKPFVPKIVDVTPKPDIEQIQPATEHPASVSDEDLHDEPYLAHVNPPSQHLDDHPTNGGTSQQFPLPTTSDDEGGTPGRPGIDYPTLTVIPPTRFDCKTQRYKGFFADPETRCQVWHYCDLNGGQASFLCPNGTIFSQAALTCDWWFNVRCATTTQLYVLNESLYKYILPHSPKFPEDYSGPLVDKYLTLKFKEMEEEFKKNKNKQAASEKMDSDEDKSDESSEDSNEKDSSSEETADDDNNTASENSADEPSVIVESPGTSGNVERLHE
ncbi:uncharacterized protein LOC142976523 [Anticarsia gemmatalis]|uniref:uncharacterized protein LOC142976523 n=1 Tax=Anticarsia gemmatalis TaxID=129554 RepID=UPI003F76B6EB